MQLIVTNRCYGGFALSPAAEKRLNELKGNTDPDDIKWLTDWNVARDDEHLLLVLHELGLEASAGEYCELEITEIPDGVEWVIEENDGHEIVAEKHRIW